jgi:hypothetical protein
MAVKRKRDDAAFGSVFSYLCGNRVIYRFRAVKPKRTGYEIVLVVNDD